jgi:hypothetical protein
MLSCFHYFCARPKLSTFELARASTEGDRMRYLAVLSLFMLGVSCSDDESGPGSGGASGAGGTSGAGTTVVACNTGNGPNEGCSEVPVPNAAVQAYKDDCTDAGSVVSDRCPTADASAKCTPRPGVIGPLTPNVIYHYALADAQDIEEARQDCAAMGGTFEVL